MSSIADIRTDYILSSLGEAEAGDHPILFFNKWFEEASKAEVLEINAMTLATVDAQSKPHARIVLLKSVDNEGFSFFTNYQSLKGQNLSENPNAALVFFWAELERQVRIEGVVQKVSASESDNYFHSRPTNSQIGAWASPQSQSIPDRHFLEQKEALLQAQYSGKDEIPRPDFWGGYKVIPSRIEFWQGRANRLHDRIVFIKQADNSWVKQRLAP